MKGCIFVSFRYLDTDTITKSWLKMYLRTRYRSKLGWFFWFGPIHVTIRRNLEWNRMKYIKRNINDYNFRSSVQLYHPAESRRPNRARRGSAYCLSPVCCFLVPTDLSSLSIDHLGLRLRHSRTQSSRRLRVRSRHTNAARSLYLSLP